MPRKSAKKKKDGSKAFLIIAGTLALLTVGFFLLRKQPIPLPTQPQPTIISPEEIVYKGRTPCGDCEGIDTVLSLNVNHTYSLKLTYIGRDTEPYTEKGTWEIKKGTPNNPNASYYMTTSSDGQTKTAYFIKNDKEVQQTDVNLNPIDSPEFTLSR